MADPAHIPAERVQSIKTSILGSRSAELARHIARIPGPALTPAQINSRQFPGDVSMLEYAYLNVEGVNGVKCIEKILAKKPTFSARIFFQKPKDFICPGYMLSHPIFGSVDHPDDGIVIADLTVEEKGRLIVTLAINYPSNFYYYGDAKAHGNYSSIPTMASELVKKLLTTAPLTIHPKYINAALYYVKHAFQRKHKTKALLYPNHTQHFEYALVHTGHAVDIEVATINQTETPAQVSYKEKTNAATAKEAAAAARAAAYAARIETYRANIGGNIAKILKEKVLEAELLAYLNTEEGIPKLKEKLCKEAGIEEQITILEYAILNQRETIVNGLLAMPDLEARMDKDSNIMVHVMANNWAQFKNPSCSQYIESPLFTIADIPMATLYTILHHAVSLTMPTLVLKIFEEKGVNPVNVGGVDPPLDPTKLNIYYVYYDPHEHEDRRYMTLYTYAGIISNNNPYPFLGATTDDADTIKDIIKEGFHGDITAKELAAIAKKRAEVEAPAPDFLMPPPGPLRDGDPATEARAVAAARAHPVLWKGFSKTEDLFLKDIFKADVVVPGQTTERPSINAGFCPVCLVFTPRGAGCIYMKHVCNPTDIINKTLYSKYKNPYSHTIYWCTVCNRPCSDHGHYKVSNMFGPVPAHAPSYVGIEIYGTACESLGGGGLLEKMGRFDALRKEAKALLPLIGTISHKEARLRLAKAFWNAPMTDYKPAATALLTAAGFENDPFSNIDEGAPVAFGNIPYIGGTLLEGDLTNEVMAAEKLHVGDVLLPEVRHEDIEAANSLDIANPVIRYRHRKPDNTINLHVGEYYSIVGIFNSLASHSTTLAEAGGTFGQCPTCPAILHPDEIKHILNEILFDVDEWDTYNTQYIEYKRNYNRVIGQRLAAAANAAVVDGGGNNNNAIEDESGPVSNNTFPEMDNAECAIVKGGRRPRTIKRIKLRQRTTRSRPMYVVKKQSRRQRRSSTKKKARR